ncbi:MAG: ATP-binding protein [Epsilonproteobacteria bacterium]|nr:ATP-binding protein [Campylobacterota bacterium]
MFIGREKELKKLDEIYHKNSSSYIAIYGRRRIGKTEIVRHFAKEKRVSLFLEITGQFNTTMSYQLDNFLNRVERFFSFSSEKRLDSWSSAFNLLESKIDELKFSDGEKIILFFDEMPWLDSDNSNFFSSISYFWNTYCEKRNDIILIVCGSSASYMINRVIRDRGPNHNRLTDTLPMFAFDLKETREMLSQKGFILSDMAVVETYMTFGGVAKYLSYLNPQLTLKQNIQKLCFEYGGMLVDEYDNLFVSLFGFDGHHQKIVDILASKWSGFTQSEIMKKMKTTASMKKPLEELEVSGFLSKEYKFGQKSRDIVYRLQDPFSYFYSKWMRGVNSRMLINNDNYWHEMSSSSSYDSWKGFAFENVCHMHIKNIKKALGISGILTQSNYWTYRAKDKDEKGAQIDLLIKHVKTNDIDIVECKYSRGEFTISKRYRDEILSKISVFNEQTKYKYNLRVIFITSNGIKRNEHYGDVCQSDFSLESLF